MIAPLKKWTIFAMASRADFIAFMMEAFRLGHESWAWDLPSIVEDSWPQAVAGADPGSYVAMVDQDGKVLKHVSRLQRQCPLCGTARVFDLDYGALTRWENGAMIQDVFPDLPAGDRETIVSGICEPCFDRLYEEEA